MQWDPERTPRMGVLPYRSIQIGIGRRLSQKWAEEWIESIEDVTSMAELLRVEVEKRELQTVEEFVAKGCMPVERVYELPDELREHLRMDGGADS